jgi:hypothetical protein
VADAVVPWGLLPLFFAVAVLYASVGHGGASGYLAVLALAGFASPRMVPLVLLLNICVAAVSFVTYWRRGFFSARLLLPFVFTSIPAAFLGGRFPVSDKLLALLLGLALLTVALRLVLPAMASPGAGPPRERAFLWPLGAAIGLALGFVSGVIGIGGGVFLSPLLLLAGWADNKRTAAVSSAFVVLNSLAGLAGRGLHGLPAAETMAVNLAVLVAGGLLGARLGAGCAAPLRLRSALAAVLAVAGVKLLLPAFG